MPERAGYTLSVYAIDVSPSMGEEMENTKGKNSTKLGLVKELVARRCEPKVSCALHIFWALTIQISSGRKTEAVGILSFGGSELPTYPSLTLRLETNNQAHRAYVAANPEDEDPPYAAVACDVAIQTAKPRTLEEVINLEVGAHEGNRESPSRLPLTEPAVSALMVALDMIHTHKHTKSWALEVVLITDGGSAPGFSLMVGESAFNQDEYEDAMMRFDELGVRLSVM